MWINEEYSSFNKISKEIGKQNFDKALEISGQLLSTVSYSSIKTAYILGCRHAIILRHLGRTEEAEKAFKRAFDLAQSIDEPVIMAYILNDRSSMRRGVEAINMIRSAIKYCQQADRTPDKYRVLIADIAYFQATLAHTLQAEKMGSLNEVRDMLASAKVILKQHALKRYPRYHQAYFIVLCWNMQLPIEHSPLGLLRYAGDLGSAAMEVIRQRNLKLILQLLR